MSISISVQRLISKGVDVLILSTRQERDEVFQNHSYFKISHNFHFPRCYVSLQKTK